MIAKAARRPPLRAIRLYVGNLPYGTTEIDLAQLFAAAGTVQSVEVVRYRETGYPRGFAFVQMTTDADALTALARFNGVSFGGRQLAVVEARPGHDRQQF